MAEEYSQPIPTQSEEEGMPPHYPGAAGMPGGFDGGAAMSDLLKWVADAQVRLSKIRHKLSV